MCTGPGLVGGPGTCECRAGLFGTPVFAGTNWTNPCLTTAVKIYTSLTLTGTTVEIMSTLEKRDEFAEAVEEAIRQQSGLEAKVTNVVATKVERRRQILSETVQLAYALVLPAAQGGEQSTFDAAVADLTAAASGGGAIATSLTSLGTVATDAFVAPATFNPIDSATTW